MSGTVENFNYVVYNEYEKPMQFAGQTPNLFEFKRILGNSQPNLPHVYTTTKPPSNGERQILSDEYSGGGGCSLQSNLGELAEILNSTTGKPGHERSVNVYNKCVFFVNSYGGSDVQDASKILSHLTDTQLLSAKRKEPSSFEITNPLPVHTAMSVNEEHSFTGPYSDYTPPVQICSVAPTERHQPFTGGAEDPIILSDTEDEPDEPPVRSEPTEKLFYVDRYDLKPILTPNILPGVYKKIVPVEATATVPQIDAKLNVYRSTSQKSGAILTAKEFSESYITNRDIAIKTDELICDSPPPADTAAITESGPKVLESNSAVSIPNPSVHRAVVDEVSRPFEKRNYCGDNLRQLAYNILKFPMENSNLQFNRERNELIHHSPTTKSKVVYRILQPEDLQLVRNHSSTENGLGNPTFVQCINVVEQPLQQIAPVPQPTTRSRPRKRPHKPKSTNSTPQSPTLQKPDSTSTPNTKSSQQSPSTTTTISSRTRRGRVSKLPNFIESNFKISPPQPLHPPTLFDNAKDCDYRFNSTQPPPLEPIGGGTPIATTTRQRNIPAEYRCKVCNKTYLGRNRMIQHIGTHPDHFIGSKNDEIIKETSLYAFLVKKVQQSALTEDQRITLLLNELTDFVTQLQSRRSQLITHNSAIYFVNSVVSKLLGAPEGHYGVDLNALNEMPRPPEDDTGGLHVPPPPRLDYNLSISLDDTIADAKLNLSENMITSDDSLLRTVEDLCKEGIKSLTEDDTINRLPVVPSVINYDHVNDNAVEAVNMKEMQPPPMLDLSLDLFQFNSN